MEALFTAVTTVVSNIMTLLGTVGTDLIANPIFQVMFGLVILNVVIRLIFKLVHKVRG